MTPAVRMVALGLILGDDGRGQHNARKGLDRVGTGRIPVQDMWTLMAA